ncbi:short-chain dehydrogenase/reductase SDR (plasmid) [Scytonema sp. HK-05]|uniref:SDR family oxidoreductase n=1 Tax=Scytonema sp. HK-05 TaxID=1137095 RepID=UPI00093697EE|nr:SDR family oxidoreductase [Scytonema sp. HK-05]OKH54369.1 3-ketoacyl-ACP reductase [Scytonema sp. HK-05]BAY50452.1 short-chain dehydrogenase/reductase SDR [Scytonema sp. HK-05]
MAPLVGKIAIVTGATSGIGRAIAERLAQDGASVVVNYAHSADKAKEVVSAIEAEGGKALAVQANLSQVVDIRRLFQKTVEHFGQLNILVNNAVSAGAFNPLTEVTEAEFDVQFGLNARGTFFALQEAARRMADGGRIVNISTAITLNNAPVGAGVYTGSKAAVEQFTIALAKELGGRSITVNSVSPGTTETEGFRKTAPPDVQAQAAQMSPLGHIGQPEDIADVVAFLVSHQARWINAQNIRATGGA